MPLTMQERCEAENPQRSEVNINVRVTRQDKEIITTAARVTRKTTTQFILDSTRQAAVDAILDQTVFHVDERTWAEFQAALDAPPKPKAALKALMARRPPWEQ